MIVAAIAGYVGLAGALLSGLMMIWHAIRLVSLGQIGLLTNGFRFLDRKRHPQQAKPHVGAVMWWFCILAGSVVVFGIGVAGGGL